MLNDTMPCPHIVESSSTWLFGRWSCGSVKPSEYSTLCREIPQHEATSLAPVTDVLMFTDSPRSASMTSRKHASAFSLLSKTAATVPGLTTPSMTPSQSGD